MENVKYLTMPLDEATVRELKVGDVVYLTGDILTARDMGHLNMRKLMEKGAELPYDLKGRAVFHAGPVCLRNEDGSWRLNVIGPTTSIRMEPYADMVGQLGVNAVIGKGGMDQGTLDACAKYGYVYLQAPPGCAALLAQGIVGVNNADKDPVWFEMGMPEALWSLKADKFGPMIVGMDTHGNSIYKDTRARAAVVKSELYPEK